ncbi:phosphoglycerate mutase family protein [Piscinibacter sp. XHJ-5]|uniref:SixA phosphatase family protein n=1 Tax=Piscinibacter sp. XHJ-5 TaxID=3037797 RepID=UPI002452BD1E|nr:phosphoglycerate mutase family protein [Piscinibacter sp. XHJ-5]
MTLRRVLALTLLACAPLAVHAQLAVILVRHAEFQGEPLTPQAEIPLSKAGEARAKRLAAMFKNAGIAQIYVTEFVRTAKTAEPLARQIGRKPTVLPKADVAGLIDKLRTTHPGQRVMVIGHNDTLPDILSALGHPKHIQLKPYDYGNVFVVVPNGRNPPAVVRLRSD